MYAVIGLALRLVQIARPTVELLATAGFIDAALKIVAGERETSAVFAPIAVLLSCAVWDLAVGFLFEIKKRRRNSLY